MMKKKKLYTISFEVADTDETYDQWIERIKPQIKTSDDLSIKLLCGPKQVVFEDVKGNKYGPFDVDELMTK